MMFLIFFASLSLASVVNLRELSSDELFQSIGTIQIRNVGPEPDCESLQSAQIIGSVSQVCETPELIRECNDSVDFSQYFELNDFELCPPDTENFTRGPECAEDFWLPLDKLSAVEANATGSDYHSVIGSALPCCPGYQCPPNVACMLKCAAGSFCPPIPRPLLQGLPTPIVSDKQNVAIDLVVAKYSPFLDCVGLSRFEICEEGHYCPSALNKSICSAGNYCPRGSSEEKACNFASICKEGSHTVRPNLFPLVLLGAVIIVLLGLYALWKLVLKARNAGQIAVNEPRRERDRNAADFKSDFGLKVTSANYYKQVPSPEFIMASSQVFKCPLDDCRRTKKREKWMYDPKLLAKTSEDLKESLKSMPQAYSSADVDALHQITVKWHDMSLKVGDRYVVQPCTGMLKAGRVVAVMGGSGSGKSSFLAALSGTGSSYGTLGGNVYLSSPKVNNGAFAKGYLKDLQNFLGFVPQEDIMQRKLTVYQNLMFQAGYRVPAASSRMRERIVKRTMAALNLSHTKDSPIGDESTRGISGGERKRVNVAMEVVASPSVLILDEPTSGLDASSSIQLMLMLKKMAEQGVLVIAVIHQPRVEIYQLLDDCVLMGKGGRMVYCGARHGVIPYFATHFNIVPTTVQNPADCVLDILADESQLEAFDSAWRGHKSNAESSTATQDTFPSLYRAGLPNFFAVVRLCFARCAQQFRVNFKAEMLFVLIFFLGGLIIGVVQPIDTIRARDNAGLLLYVSAALPGVLKASGIFGLEMTEYHRDARAGLNRASYFFAKCAFDLSGAVYLSLVIVLGFFIFGSPLGSLFSYWLLFAMALYAVQGVGYAASTFFDASKSQIIAIFFIAISLIFTGTTPSIGQLKDILSSAVAYVLIHLSLCRHVFENMFVLESNEAGAVLKSEYDEIADFYEYQRTTSKSIFYLFGIGTAFRVITLLNLFLRWRAKQNRAPIISSLFSSCKLATSGGKERKPQLSIKPSSRRTEARSSSFTLSAGHSMQAQFLHKSTSRQSGRHSERKHIHGSRSRSASLARVSAAHMRRSRTQSQFGYEEDVNSVYKPSVLKNIAPSSAASVTDSATSVPLSAYTGAGSEADVEESLYKPRGGLPNIAPSTTSGTGNSAGSLSNYY